MSKDRKAIVKKTNEGILVYRSSQRDTYINSFDLETEYKPSELKLIG